MPEPSTPEPGDLDKESRQTKQQQSPIIGWRRRRSRRVSNSERSQSERSPITRDSELNESDGLPDRYTAQQVEYNYSGPLPDPMMLRAYQELYPTAAEQLFEQSRQETEHRMRMEEREFEANRSALFRGQWMAFILGTGCLTVLALVSNGGWAVGVALGSITILAGLLITSHLRRNGSIEEPD